MTPGPSSGVGKPVVFTDLDGTLLDAHTYSFGPAKEALGLLKKLEIPVIICSSKTRAEILYWRQRLGNPHPFVAENGGGVYVPAGYFGFGIPGVKETEGFSVMEFGTPYPKLREAVASLRAKGFAVRGFGDMMPEEVARLTGLPMDDARLAKAREFDEPFVYSGEKELIPRLVEAVKKMGLGFTEGRLMHILGDNDKGRAVRWLSGHYIRKYGDVVTAAIGDSPNDLPMLLVVDHPFLVRKPEGSHDPGIMDDRIVKVDGIGPEGWAEAVMRLLRRLELV